MRTNVYALFYSSHPPMFVLAPAPALGNELVANVFLPLLVSRVHWALQIVKIRTCQLRPSLMQHDSVILSIENSYLPGAFRLISANGVNWLLVRTSPWQGGVLD